MQSRPAQDAFRQGVLAKRRGCTDEVELLAEFRTREGCNVIVTPGLVYYVSVTRLLPAGATTHCETEDGSESAAA